MDSTVRFIQAYPDAHPIMRADKTAMGTIPAAALRYCEALRAASSFGWYVFPARSVTVLFDGIDTYMQHGSEWELLDSEFASDPDDWWNCSCPEWLSDLAPPFATSISNPGMIQIWSGFFVQTKNDWSILVRPLANTSQSAQFSCFEGIIETDRFSPAPLFVNIRLTATDTPIVIKNDMPMFQVQPIHRMCYSSENLKNYRIDSLDKMSDEDWNGYRGTIRAVDPEVESHQIGRYAIETRKRAKAG